MAGERTRQGLSPVKNAVRSVIRDALIAKGWTYQKLADEIGMTAPSVSRFMNSEHWLTFANINKIASVLDLNLNQIFERVPKTAQEYQEFNPYAQNLSAVETFAETHNVSCRNIDEWLKRLTPIQHIVVMARHLTYPKARQDELASYANLSKQRISQIEADAIKKLKEIN